LAGHIAIKARHPVEFVILPRFLNTLSERRIKFTFLFSFLSSLHFGIEVHAELLTIDPARKPHLPLESFHEEIPFMTIDPPRLYSRRRRLSIARCVRSLIFLIRNLGRKLLSPR
jgi:hypothetical protein